ncbi:MAG: TonB-dependent receptor, partial [Bacteroidota bacterium]
MKRPVFTAAFFFFHLALFAQKQLELRLDFEVQEVKIEEAVRKLDQTSGIRFAFSSDIFPTDRRISLSMQNASIKSILTQILKNTDVQYKLVGNQIVLYFKPRPPAKYTISGYIMDAVSGEKLISANVYEADSRRGASSNIYGFYSLTLEEGIREIRFSYLGYETILKKLNVDANTKINISLKPALTLSEVVVTARPRSGNTSVISTYDIVPERYETLPTLGGEVDVIRLAHLLPGVQTGADGVGGIHIRGGNADQNLVLLDGVPVYNPAHMAGIFSVFNSKAIKSARLIKGSFPARYGGRLSSILDVRTKEGNKKEYRKEFNIGLTSAKLSIEGPLKKDTSSFFLSARRSFLDLFVRPVSERIKEDRGETGFSTYNFYDLNAKFNISAGSRDELFASFYRGGDQFRNETGAAFQNASGTFSFRQSDSQDLEWGNTVASLRWNHIFGSKLFSNASINYTRYQFESRDFFSYQDTLRTDSSSLREFNIGKFNSLIEDIGARIDFDFIPSPNHYWRFGAELTRHFFRPGVAALNDAIALSFPDVAFIFSSLDSIDNPSITNLEGAVYLEDEWQITPRLHANIGLRASLWQADEKTYYNL